MEARVQRRLARQLNDKPSFIRILILSWTVIFVDFALFVMQDYLTNIWNLAITHAAGIVNIVGGISNIVPLFFIFCVRGFIGNFKMLTFSSIAYTLGIGLVAMSTPPVLARVTHTCKTFDQNCIGHVQKALFYTGMALIPIGVAGHTVSFDPFLKEQGFIKEGGLKDFKNLSMFKLFRYALVVVIALAGAIGLPYIKPWSLRFGIPAITSLFTTLFFLTGSCYDYQKPEPKGNTIHEKEVRFVLRMIPVCLTVIICGIVSSTANSYFVEQASNMNRHLGGIKVPLQILLLVNRFTFFCFSQFKDKLPRDRGVAAAIIFSILCCITAAKVETMRLDTIRKHGLADKPNETIPMSVFWLLFQFILLAGIDSFLESSVTELYKDGIEECNRDYLEHLIKAMSGLGYLGAVLAVYVVGRVSEQVDKTNWFQATVNKSRLDNYYWVLAVLSSANLIMFSVVALTCIVTNKEHNKAEAECDGPIELS